MKLTVYSHRDPNAEGAIRSTTYQSPGKLDAEAVRNILCELSRSATLVDCLICNAGTPAVSLIAWAPAPGDLCVAPACPACVTARRPNGAQTDLYAARDGAIFEVGRP